MPRSASPRRCQGRIPIARIGIPLLGVFIASFLTKPAAAVPFDNNAKILLHLSAPTNIDRCASGDLTDCRDAVTAGGLYVAGNHQAYFAYVLVAPGGILGTTGLQFGITYEQGRPIDDRNHAALDIFSWTLCATLEFQQPSPTWPKPGAGNLIVYSTCQTTETAVAGYFYVAAYGADQLKIIPRPIDGQAKLADCCSSERILNQASLGSAAFSAEAQTSGCNPCDGPCPGASSASSTGTGCTPPPPPPPVRSEAAILLHITTPVSKNTCANGLLSDPADAVVSASTADASGPFYFVYLLAARETEPSIAGIQCGITYENHQPGDLNNGSGVDVFGWTSCAAQEFQTPGVDQWPRPGGGNLLTWDPDGNCQTGATAVAGYFYVGAYSPDEMRVTARPVDGLAKVAKCSGGEVNLEEDRLGFVSFSGNASVPGCNPWSEFCGGDAVPIQKVTWGGVKALIHSSTRSAGGTP